MKVFDKYMRLYTNSTSQNIVHLQKDQRCSELRLTFKQVQKIYLVRMIESVSRFLLINAGMIK